ncbi:MAG: LuxR C-terminal-related transcriptional regulator, partial [Bacteroidota bacterium]
EIAEKLFISPRTVDGHRNNLLEKLSCRNTAGLVVYAIHHKLVEVVPDTFWNQKL